MHCGGGIRLLDKRTGKKNEFEKAAKGVFFLVPQKLFRKNEKRCYLMV